MLIAEIGQFSTACIKITQDILVQYQLGLYQVSLKKRKENSYSSDKADTSES